MFTRAIAAVSALLCLSCCTGTALADPPAYYPYGPQTSVGQTSLAGWSLCYSGTYNATVPLSTVLGPCDGAYLLLAGRAVGSTTLTLLAAAPRGDVLFDTGQNDNAVHQANGSGWYFHDAEGEGAAWGFAPAGWAVAKTTCDTAETQGALRLCWHLFNHQLEGGWRLGTITGLNYSTQYERLVYEPANPPGALAGVTSLSFSEQQLGTVGAPQRVVVTNDGTGPLLISSVPVTGPGADDFIVGDGCRGSVPPGRTCSIAVRFAPQAAGARAATLSLDSDKPGAQPTVALAGTGREPPTIAAGTPGTTGATGATGAPGPVGATGPRGPAGPRSTVVCTVRKANPASKVKVTCTVTAKKATTARLVRRGRTVARRRVAGGRRTLTFTVPRTAGAGAYRLVLAA